MRDFTPRILTDDDREAARLFGLRAIKNLRQHIKENYMRKAIVSKITGYLNGITQYEERGEVKFHAWGCDYEEFETGPGNFSTAIVEWPSGQIENIPAPLIRFIEHEIEA